MVTATDIVAEARTWLGTPFRHQGRVRGSGVDCIGLVIGVARALGLGDYTEPYPRNPDPHRMALGLADHFERISNPEIAAVVWLSFGRVPTHLGLLTAQDRLIHAYEPRGQVVEHGIDARWARRIISFHRFRGID